MLTQCALPTNQSVSQLAEPKVDIAKLDELLPTCARDIERAYGALGHTLGWRFMTGPLSTLHPLTDVALITLNPGGTVQDAHQTGASYEPGSAYVHESWCGRAAGQAPLQQQVQALVSELMVHRGEAGSVADFLANRMLTAHFIPFRSPTFATLHNTAESIAFARKLWTRVLQQWLPSVLLTIDREGFSNLNGILTSGLGGYVSESRTFQTGWGNYTADGVRYKIPGRSTPVTMVRLPHLSRFTLFAEPGYSANRKAALKPMFWWLNDVAAS